MLNTEKIKTKMIHENDPPVFGGKLSIFHAAKFTHRLTTSLALTNVTVPTINV